MNEYDIDIFSLNADAREKSCLEPFHQLVDLLGEIPDPPIALKHKMTRVLEAAAQIMNHEL